MKRSDRELMRRCFELAEEARVRGDTPVGSLIAASDGEIIAEASERNRTEGPFSHAELLVVQYGLKIRQNNDLTGITLFTTNEPCFMCSFAIRHASISKVVFAKRTQGIGGFSSHYPILSASDIGNWKAVPEIIFLEERNQR